MPTENDRHFITARIAGLVAAFESGADGGEPVALDIVELIAMRMCSREDQQVCVLGFFVRANLVALDQNVISFAETVSRLVAAAMAAPEGNVQLTQTFDAGLGDLFL